MYALCQTRYNTRFMSDKIEYTDLASLYSRDRESILNIDLVNYSRERERTIHDNSEYSFDRASHTV